MNKFIIYGTPRSCTTFLCNQLNNFDKIFMPVSNGFELYNLDNYSYYQLGNFYEEDKIFNKIEKYAKENGYQFVGTKILLQQVLNLKSLIDELDLSIFVVLRRDFWKVLCSSLTSGINCAFDKSGLESTRFVYNKYDGFHKTVIIMLTDILLDTYYKSEKHLVSHRNFKGKVYFEDIINGSANLNPFNDYFGINLELATKYKDDHDASLYIENFHDMKKDILAYIRRHSGHFSFLPAYLKEYIFKYD